MDLLRAIRTFSEIERNQSFSATARAFNVSVTAVSRQMQELETWCGLQLLNRTTRKVSLTHEGERYLHQMRDIADQVSGLESSLKSERESPSGLLRITAPVFISSHFLAPILPKFLVRYPDIELKLDVLDRRVDLVSEGYDLAIRVGILEDAAIHARRIAGFGLKMVASPDYLARQGTPNCIDDLSQHAALVDTVARFRDRWPLMEDGVGRKVKMNSRVEVSNGDVIRELAIAGIGIALLPDWMVAAALKEGRLTSILEDCVDFDAGVYAIYPSRRYRSSNIRAFIDFLLEHQQLLN